MQVFITLLVAVLTVVVRRVDARPLAFGGPILDVSCHVVFLVGHSRRSVVNQLLLGLFIEVPKGRFFQLRLAQFQRFFIHLALIIKLLLLLSLMFLASHEVLLRNGSLVRPHAAGLVVRVLLLNHRPGLWV